MCVEAVGHYSRGFFVVVDCRYTPMTIRDGWKDTLKGVPIEGDVLSFGIVLGECHSVRCKEEGIP
jgi:hypothetical protein